MRGRETSVVCASCGRTMPRNKAVADEKAVRFGTDMKNAQDVRFFERLKVYYCVSCAKHRGIFEKKRRQAIERAKREL